MPTIHAMFMHLADAFIQEKITIFLIYNARFIRDLRSKQEKRRNADIFVFQSGTLYIKKLLSYICENVIASTVY